jgi:GNAT superfamily N-acetyltransferase
LTTNVSEIIYRFAPPVTDEALNALFAASWPQHQAADFQTVLGRSLTYVCAYQGERLVGFVNVAWDGGVHAFILDTRVHPTCRRQGIGVGLVQQAIQAARSRGIEWLHVDFEPPLRPFYERCGFRSTQAGLMRLS